MQKRSYSSKKDYGVFMWAAVALTALLTAACIVYGCAKRVEIMLVIDGRSVGYVESRDTVEQACDMLTEQVYRASGTLYKYGGAISYRLSRIVGKVEYLSVEGCLKLLGQNADVDYIEAYALYVDDRAVAYCANEAEIRVALNRFVEAENEYVASYGDITAQLDTNCVILPEVTVRSALLTGNELYELLCASKSRDYAWLKRYAAESDKNGVEIAQYELTLTPKFMYGEYSGESVVSGATEPTVGVEKVEQSVPEEGLHKEFVAPDYSPALPATDSVQHPDNSEIYGTDRLYSALFSVESYAIDGVEYGISPTSGGTDAPLFTFTYTCPMTEFINTKSDTVFQYTSDRLIGYERVLSEGIDGVSIMHYNQTYRNGELISQEAAEETVITEKTDRVMAVGTRKQGEPGVATGHFMWPLYYDDEPMITSYYGARRAAYDGSGYHLGVDVFVQIGTEVYASDSGVVSLSQYSGSYGNMVIIDHADGYQSCYAHLDSMIVEVGDKVYGGQLIAYSGETGTVSMCHLHFEIRKDLHTQDPLKYLPEY